MKKRLLVFNSASPQSGGSGFERLVEYERSGFAEYHVVGLVVDRSDSFAIKRAIRLGIPYTVLRPYSKDAPYVAEEYQLLVQRYAADFVALSGWLKPVVGLDPKTTFNIHPGPLPKFGGKRMYGHYVHEAVFAARVKGELTASAVCMHFVDEIYDHGPVFFRFPVNIEGCKTPGEVGSLVNECEQAWQKIVTNFVVMGEIRWDGKDPSSLVIPEFIKTVNALVA